MSENVTISDRPRVLVIATWYPSGERPAVAPFVVRHVEAIGRGSDVTVLHVRLGASGGTLTENYRGQRLVRLGLNPRRPFAALRALRRIRRMAREFDLVHTMAFSAGLVARVALIGRRPPWVHSEHWSGVSRPESVSRAWQRLSGMRRILRAPDWLTAVSSSLAASMQPWSRTGRLSIVPCVVESPDPVVAAPHGDTARLVAVGGLVEGKQPLVAVQIVRWLIDHGTPVTMTWVGDGPLRSAVDAAIREAGLVGEMTVTGAIEPQAVFDHLAAAAEALTCGRPVVLPEVGGFTDYADETNAVLLQDVSVEGFGRGIQAAIERFRDVSAAQIVETVRGRFTADQIGAAFEEIYRTLLVERGAVPPHERER